MPDWRDVPSPAGYKPIVRWETGGYAYYEQVIKGRPIWPGFASGITIGCGYDLGYPHRRVLGRLIGEPPCRGNGLHCLAAVMGFLACWLDEPASRMTLPAGGELPPERGRTELNSLVLYLFLSGSSEMLYHRVVGQPDTFGA